MAHNFMSLRSLQFSKHLLTDCQVCFLIEPSHHHRPSLWEHPGHFPIASETDVQASCIKRLPARLPLPGLPCLSAADRADILIEAQPRGCHSVFTSGRTPPRHTGPPHLSHLTGQLAIANADGTGGDAHLSRVTIIQVPELPALIRSQSQWLLG